MIKPHQQPPVLQRFWIAWKQSHSYRHSSLSWPSREGALRAWQGSWNDPKRNFGNFSLAARPGNAGKGGKLNVGILTARSSCCDEDFNQGTTSAHQSFPCSQNWETSTQIHTADNPCPAQMQRGRILVPEQVGLLCLLTENRVIKNLSRDSLASEGLNSHFFPKYPKCGAALSQSGFKSIPGKLKPAWRKL